MYRHAIAFCVALSVTSALLGEERQADFAEPETAQAWKVVDSASPAVNDDMIGWILLIEDSSMHVLSKDENQIIHVRIHSWQRTDRAVEIDIQGESTNCVKAIAILSHAEVSLIMRAGYQLEDIERQKIENRTDFYEVWKLQRISLDEANKLLTKLKASN